MAVVLNPPTWVVVSEVIWSVLKARTCAVVIAVSSSVVKAMTWTVDNADTCAVLKFEV